MCAAGRFVEYALAGMLGFAATAFGGQDPNDHTLARIALLSDTHVLTVTNAKQAAYHAHLARAISEVNTAGVDLVLIAGDLTDQGKPEQMEQFQKEVDALKAPVWFVPGNHDIGNEPSAGKPSIVSSDRVALYEKRLGPSFFDRSRAGLRVIGINASLFGSDLPEEAQMWSFLEARLAETNAGPVLVLSHNPPFTKSVDEPASYNNIEPKARRRLLHLLAKEKVPALLSGHLHHPLVNRRGNLLLLTTPPVSFGLPAGAQNEGWTLVTVSEAGVVRYEFRLFKRGR